MGMYSYFDYEDIEIINYEGLIDFLDRWEKYLKEYKKGEGWEKLTTRKALINETNKTISFDCWEDIKLISYWYGIEVVFLKCIAKYIEGNVCWTFENKNEGGEVKFQDGRCIICIGEMSWKEFSPREIMGGNYPEIDEDKILNKFMTLSDL